jgi:hypothetical protein
MNKTVNRNQDLLRRRPLALRAIGGVNSRALVAAELRGKSPGWGIESVAPCLLPQPFGFSNFTFLFTRLTVTWCRGFRDGDHKGPTKYLADLKSHRILGLARPKNAEARPRESVAEDAPDAPMAAYPKAVGHPRDPRRASALYPFPTRKSMHIRYRH